jgi:hypothetical protein
MPLPTQREEVRRIAANITKLPEFAARAKLPGHGACAFAVHLSGNVVIEQMLRYALVAIA